MVTDSEQSLTSHGSAMLDSTDLGHSQPVFEPETANISTATHKRTCQVFHGKNGKHDFYFIITLS